MGEGEQGFNYLDLVMNNRVTTGAGLWPHRVVDLGLLLGVRGWIGSWEAGFERFVFFRSFGRNSYCGVSHTSLVFVRTNSILLLISYFCVFCVFFDRRSLTLARSRSSSHSTSY